MKYSVTLRFFHWSMAIIMLSLIAVGFYLANRGEDSPVYNLYPLHESFGFIILVLTFMRLYFRKKGPIPPPNNNLKQWEIKLSSAAHYILYASMIVMGSSGYMMVSTYSGLQGLDMFGWFVIPDITEKSEYWNEIFHIIHTIAAYTLSFVLFLHIVGVIKHKYFDKADTDVLKRMM